MELPDPWLQMTPRARERVTVALRNDCWCGCLTARLVKREVAGGWSVRLHADVHGLTDEWCPASVEARE